MEDKLIGRQPHGKTTKQEDNLTGRQPHRKNAPLEDNFTEIQPRKKMNSQVGKYSRKQYIKLTGGHLI